jgi:hypothetical protein
VVTDAIESGAGRHQKWGLCVSGSFAHGCRSVRSFDVRSRACPGAIITLSGETIRICHFRIVGHLPLSCTSATESAFPSKARIGAA